MFQIKIKKQLNNLGFTLLEVLVTVAIIGLLFVVSSAIFINSVRSANKANITNEAKENYTLVLDSLTRDVRNATGAITVSGVNVLTIPTANGTSVIWTCVTGGSGNNNFLTRQVGVGSAFPITNKDPKNGVSISNCANIFSVSGTFPSNLVTLNISFTEGAGITGGSQDITALVSHTVSIGNRGN